MMKTDLFRALIMIILFAVMFVLSFVGIFYNPAHIATTIMFAILLIISVNEYKKTKLDD